MLVSDLPQKVQELQRLQHLLWEKSPEGAYVRRLLAEIRSVAEPIIDQERQENPLAFLQMSWEQALKCNLWVWGSTFYCDFDANRIGKTACTIFNAQLWMFPNDPSWKVFQPYEDHLNRLVRVLRRPKMDVIRKIREHFAAKTPAELAQIPLGNPRFQPYDPENEAALAYIQERFDISPIEPSTDSIQKPEGITALLNQSDGALETPSLPSGEPPSTTRPTLEAPISKSINVIWIGAPDFKVHKDIIMPAWRKWLPKSAIVRDSEHDQRIILKIQNPNTTSKWSIILKSYDAKDTKWSGDAVTGINLTEGVPQAIFNEVRQRFTPNGFGAWDYTPYEARNTGSNAALAFNVFKGKEKLPLKAHVFTGMGIEATPSYILDDSKRKDLIDMWAGKAEGTARIKGMFFSSSPLVLSHLDRNFHALPLTIHELEKIRPNLLRFRSLDPGYDHPTACVWAALSPSNEWFIYRFYKKPGTTIAQRCKDIIEKSGNIQALHPIHPNIKREIHSSTATQATSRGAILEPTTSNQRFSLSRADILKEFEDDFETKLAEVATLKQFPERLRGAASTSLPSSVCSELFVATLIDYHTFKTDETTGLPVANNYVNEGLVVTPSPMTKPNDRGIKTNECLEPNLSFVHPLFKKPPGCKLYFLIGEDNGVNELLEDLEQLFWARMTTGDRAGQPKDEMQAEGDDGFDALSYLCCSAYRWMKMNLTPILQ